MFFKKIDFLTPPITLFYKGDEAHSSVFSGIISLITYSIIFIFGVYYSLEFIYKKNPTAYFFNRYIEDTGNYPVNASSMFHFIQMMGTGANHTHKYTDFNSITIYGIELSIDDYMENNDPMLNDHWIYGYCNNDSDTKGVSHLVNHELYDQALCIRKYYNKEKDTYYETNDKDFRWPSVDKGCSHPNRTFYGVILEKCRNITARKRAGYEDCKTEEEINDYIFSSSIIIQLIDYYPDVLNYEVPFTKYFYALTNGLFKDSITINNLNFNPALMKTHNGIFFDNQIDEQAYIFIQNEKITFEDKIDKVIDGITVTEKTGIVVGWYFWVLNTMEYYERNYKRLQDILGDIGGVSSIFILIVEPLNLLVSKYVLLLDTEEMVAKLSSENKEKLNQIPTIFEQNYKKIFPFKRNNYYRESNPKLKNHQRITKTYTIKKNNNNIFIKENNKHRDSNNSNIINIFLDDNSEKTNEIKMNNKGNQEKSDHSYSCFRRMGAIPGINLNENNSIYKYENDKEVENYKKSNFSFFKYIGYLFTCGKNSPNIYFYKNLRKEIISEENMAQTYFDIYKLLKSCKLKLPKNNKIT